MEVLGPVNHTIFESIYFFDPNGHRIELAANTASDDDMRRLHEVAPAMLEEWSRTKRAPKHAAWLHEPRDGSAPAPSSSPSSSSNSSPNNTPQGTQS